MLTIRLNFTFGSWVTEASSPLGSLHGVSINGNKIAGFWVECDM